MEYEYIHEPDESVPVERELPKSLPTEEEFDENYYEYLVPSDVSEAER
jgi:hypothetical protein